MTAPPPAAQPPGAEPQDIGPGSILGDRYVLHHMLGEGGMGRVFLAEDRKTDAFVAVKVLTDERPIPKAAERFMREAQSIAKIHHEHVVHVTDVGESPRGGLYYVMEYLEGEELADTLARDGPMPWWRAQKIGIQICEALQAAHEKGVVHRDLKLENCFRVTRAGEADFIKIVDFGVAKLLGPDTGEGRLTNTGTTLGTPAYMAPELCRGKQVDHRVDVYALGVMLYELLTGTVPFPGEGFLDVALQHMHAPPPPLSKFLEPEEIPDGLDAVIGRALAKQREDRFPTMSAMGRALQRVGESGGPWPSAVPTDKHPQLPQTRSTPRGTQPAVRSMERPITGRTQVVDAQPVARSASAPTNTSLITGRTQAVLDTGPLSVPGFEAPIDRPGSRLWPVVLVGLLLGVGVAAAWWWTTQTEDEAGADASAPATVAASTGAEAVVGGSDAAAEGAPEASVAGTETDAVASSGAATAGGEVEASTGDEGGETTKRDPTPRKRKGLTNAQFDATIRTLGPRLSTCVGGATGGKSGDRVRVEAKIDRATGKVLSIRAHALRGASGVDGCVEQVLRKASFPKVGTGSQAISRTIKL